MFFFQAEDGIRDIGVLEFRRVLFRSIAAVIVLGLAVGERGRRAVELTLGVAFGVAIGDLLVSFVGVGAIQAGIFVVLAMGLAVFLSRGELGVKIGRASCRERV